MTDAHKVCPVCETQNPPHAAFCTACGTHIAAVPAVDGDVSSAAGGASYDFRLGETDLFEPALQRTAQTYLVIGVTVLLVLTFVGIGWWLTNGVSSSNQATEEVPAVITTPQPQPTLNVATVTQGPPTVTASPTPSTTPTATVTPTRGPCTITMPQGQSLIWALGQCGHQSLDVLPEVLDLNDLADAASVRANQQILIPWPTPTEDPNAQPTELPDDEGDADAGDTILGDLASVDESIEAFAATTTPTLPPGVMWHQIQPEENIISVAVLYNTDVQTLSQLNRQIDFARCDFGMTYGGPECIVQLFQGQLVRVPAPTPTPTLSPTPDPNATATPTPTATFNRPSALSPADRDFFYANQLVTLRWIPSATLAEGEAYRVDVTDTTTNITYMALTTDIRFIVPSDWQGMDEQRHVYEWQVSVVSQANPDDIRYQTEPLTFVWQGLIEESE